MNALTEKLPELRGLIQEWRSDETQCRESAADYDLRGNPFFAQQLNAEADGLKRCANDLEKILPI